MLRVGVDGPFILEHLRAMASNLRAMASNLVAMASNLIAMASSLRAMACNLRAMASNLVAMASNLIAMASSLRAMACNLRAMASNLRAGLQPNSVWTCWPFFLLSSLSLWWSLRSDLQCKLLLAYAVLESQELYWVNVTKAGHTG